jgi:hypothetical protein
MAGERYDLHFGSLKVGIITQTNSDFPNLWGDISYDPVVSKPQSEEAARIAKFLELNSESTRLVDLEDRQNTSPEQEVVNAELEANYKDYIESENWHLIDERGHELPILCPILRGASEIVWRWNPSGGKACRAED